jgi:ABC-type nickel/cobalt efflux system permease component RcnA
MTSLIDLLQQGSAHAWLYLPSAVLLGALHGLEPGHSKTMMAAFIIAIRGTVMQAVLLGLSATLSHTAVVWAVALTGLYFGQRWNVEASEPYLQVFSGAIVISVALWMIVRSRREHRAEIAHQHDHDHEPEHDHADGHDSAHYEERDHDDEHHPDDNAQTVRVLGAASYQDEHEREHADEIRRRFSGREVTTGQIVLFGLTGGLIPCPASITVLVLCLQLKQISLGIGLVLGFSLGLALTMVTVGALAALGAQRIGTQTRQRWPGFGKLVRRAPYLSSALVLLIGGYLIYSGASAIR